jgi:hypothetical protein
VSVERRLTFRRSQAKAGEGSGTLTLRDFRERLTWIGGLEGWKIAAVRRRKLLEVVLGCEGDESGEKWLCFGFAGLGSELGLGPGLVGRTQGSSAAREVVRVRAPREKERGSDVFGVVEWVCQVRVGVLQRRSVV